MIGKGWCAGCEIRQTDTDAQERRGNRGGAPLSRTASTARKCAGALRPLRSGDPGAHRSRSPCRTSAGSPSSVLSQTIFPSCQTVTKPRVWHCAGSGSGLRSRLNPQCPGRGGRAALTLHHANAMTARLPAAAVIAALPGTIIGHFPFTGRCQ